LAVGGFYGEDVPGVGGDDVGRDEIDLIGGVGSAVVGDAADVGVPASLLRALDLNAEEVSVALYGEVVGGVVSPGLGDAQALFGGAGHETEFGPFATRLGVAEVHRLICHGYFRASRTLRLRSGQAASGSTCLGKKKRGLFGAAWVFCVSIFSISSWGDSTGKGFREIFCVFVRGYGELGGFGA